MRFESIVAHAFGPLLDETLELAPGMNVVYGPNEAGKSTWHAALYAGLCGMRRGGGQTAADRDFSSRHKPWNGTDAWEVSAVLVRDDGIRIELRHDLANRTATVRDADIAERDYASEIIRDGAPDGAVWLGLDRRSFLATACVRQADTVRVLQAAPGLQEVLQRAADTAGTDATAAAANDLLQKWHRDHVGTAGAYTKPLAIAKKELQQSQDHLANARDAHEEYLQRRADVERLRATADQAARVLARAEGDTAIRSPVEHAELAAQVQTAISAWSSRPGITGPTGLPVEQLEARLAEMEQQLAPPSSARIWARVLLALFVGGIGIILSFRLLDLEVFMVVASLLSLFSILAVSWQIKRSRLDSLLRERQTHMRSEIDRRREEDRRYDEDVARRDQAEDALHRAADLCGIAAGETEASAMMLERWLANWRSELETNESQQRQLAVAHREAADAMQAYARARGGLDQFARNMPDVSVAEETEQAARLAHARLERLDSTLRMTVRFLRRAEERVHRDMAPKLRASVVRHLSGISGGRYTDCRIDPQSLAVEVRSGNGAWRRADLLSHGTAEQVYLLLRMALAEHLSAPDESCPLILDDPIATSDSARREAVLDTLLAVSESAQVVLFTHDLDTRDWARNRLSEPAGALRELDRRGIPA